MRVIALIEDSGVIRGILKHLGLAAPLATERNPPLGSVNWPRYANLPLSYHPVPDIALAAEQKKTPRNSRDTGKHLPRSGGWNRLLGN